jgi:hypothetical protein
MFNLFAFEFAFVASVRVAGARNEMVAGKHGDAATAEFANVSLVHFRTGYVKS